MRANWTSNQGNASIQHPTYNKHRIAFDSKIDDESNIKIANRHVKKREYYLQQVCVRAQWNGCQNRKYDYQMYFVEAMCSRSVRYSLFNATAERICINSMLWGNALAGGAPTRIISWKIFRKSFWLNVLIMPVDLRHPAQAQHGYWIRDAWQWLLLPLSSLSMFSVYCLPIQTVAFVRTRKSMAIAAIPFFFIRYPRASFCESNKYGMH